MNNLSFLPSEFKDVSLERLIAIKHALTETIVMVHQESDPDYKKLSNNLNAIKLSIGQVEYSFFEVSTFLEKLSEKVNVKSFGEKQP